MLTQDATFSDSSTGIDTYEYEEDYSYDEAPTERVLKRKSTNETPARARDPPAVIQGYIAKGIISMHDDDQTRQRKIDAFLNRENVCTCYAYIEIKPSYIPVPPPTRTRRAAAKPPPPQLEGPIEIADDNTLDDIVSFISPFLKCCTADVDRTLLFFRYETPANSKAKPFGSPMGFQSLIDAIKKKPSSCKAIIITTSQPVKTIIPTAPIPAPERDLTPFEKKRKLDDELDDKYYELLDRYPVGLCADHPNLNCFHYPTGNLHFDIGHRPRGLVWAASLLKGEATMEVPPLASNFFKINVALKRPSIANAVNPTPPQPTPPLATTLNHPMQATFPSNESLNTLLLTALISGGNRFPLASVLSNMLSPTDLNSLPPAFNANAVQVPAAPVPAAPVLPTDEDLLPPPGFDMEKFRHDLGLNQCDINRFDEIGWAGERLEFIEVDIARRAGFGELEWRRLVVRDRFYRKLHHP